MKIRKDIVQGTLDWHFIRKGKITGTTLKALAGTPKAKQDAIYELIAERLTVGASDEHENAMDRGNRLEDEARAMFEWKTGHKVETVGFCEHEDNEFITNSPDGLIDEKGKYTRALEIKCFEGKNYVKTWLTNKIPDEYFPQALQYFVVNNDLEVLYFAAYNPEIPVYPMHIITLLRKEIEPKIEEMRALEIGVLSEINEALSKLIPL